MKKIFTLLMGAVIALSASAAPQFVAPKKAAFKKDALKKDALKVAELKANKAPKTIMATDAYTLEVIAYQAEFYDVAGGLFVYTLIDEEGSYYFFSFSSTGADPVVNGTTYTLDDMVANYCYYDWMGYNYYQAGFSTATFVKDVDVDGNVSIHAHAITDDSYQDDFTLTYQETTVVPTGDTIRLSINDLEFIDNQATKGWWQMAGYSADSLYYISLSNKTDTTKTQAIGSYDFETEMDVLYSYIYVNKEQTYFKSGSVVLSLNVDGTYHLAATLLAKTGVVFVLTLDSKAPEVSDMTFAFASDEATGITVTPSNNTDAWDWIIVDAASFAQYGADYIASAIYSQYGNYYAVIGAQLLDWENKIAPYLSDEEEDYVLVVWGAGESNVTTEAASYAFHVDAPEGIENVVLTEKAKKVVVDGVVYIVRDNMMFNIHGAQVR